MSFIVALVLSLFPSREEAEALRSTAPDYLTLETAYEHLGDARAAGLIYDVDPDLLLSLAWFESRYTVNAVGPAVSGKHACGVLQPTMEDQCDTAPTLLRGYMLGAKHVREWIDASRGDLHTAMIGYGGGYALIKACASGPYTVERGGRDVDLCTIADLRLGRAAWIRSKRDRMRSS